MYAACKFGGIFSISVFDSDKLAWSATNFFGAGHVDAISVDENHTLMISAS